MPILGTTSECLHGDWLPWLEREFGWRERTAQKYMRIAEVFTKSAVTADLDGLTIEAEALYLLSSNGSQELRQEAVNKAKGGHWSHHREVAALQPELADAAVKGVLLVPA